MLGAVFLFASLGLLIEQSFWASGILLVLTIFLVPLTGDYIVRKIMKTNLSGTHKVLRSINYSELHTILPTYQQNVLNYKKVINDKQKIKFGRKIYYNTLCTVISDFTLTQNKIAKLNEIKMYFNLSDQQIFLEKNKISEKTVKNLAQKCYADHVLTDLEDQQISNMANFLQFPSDKTREIKNKIAFSLFNRILEEKVSDNRLSPIKETELKQATRNLKIDQQSITAFISDRKLKACGMPSYYGILITVFSGVYNPPIALSRDEQCYLNVHATLIENKLVHAGYSRTSTGVSFRVMKGVNARIGGGRYRPVKENVRETYPGMLYLTNSRIVFNAGGKSFQIPFYKLISHNARGGSLELIVQTKAIHCV